MQEYHASGFEWKGFLPGEEPQEPQQEVSPEKDEQTIGKPESEFSRDHRAEYPGGTGSQGGFQGTQGGFGQPMDIEEYLRNLQRQTMDDTRGADGVSSRELSTFVGRSVMHYSQAFASFRAPVSRDRSAGRLSSTSAPDSSRRYISSTAEWTCWAQ